MQQDKGQPFGQVEGHAVPGLDAVCLEQPHRLLDNPLQLSVGEAERGAVQPFEGGLVGAGQTMAAQGFQKQGAAHCEMVGR